MSKMKFIDCTGNNISTFLKQLNTLITDYDNFEIVKVVYDSDRNKWQAVVLVWEKPNEPETT